MNTALVYEVHAKKKTVLAYTDFVYAFLETESELVAKEELSTIEEKVEEMSNKEN